MVPSTALYYLPPHAAAVVSAQNVQMAKQRPQAVSPMQTAILLD
jgi:hypothetical protein